MSRRTAWRTAFLSLTALVLAMELFAAFDGDDQTDPWTDMIVRYIPAEVTIAAIGALVLWLPAHFGLRYWRRSRSNQTPDS